MNFIDRGTDMAFVNYLYQQGQLTDDMVKSMGFEIIEEEIDDSLEKGGFGKKDISKLTKKTIVDRNGHQRIVYVKNGDDKKPSKYVKNDLRNDDTYHKKTVKDKDGKNKVIHTYGKEGSQHWTQAGMSKEAKLEIHAMIEAKEMGEGMNKREAREAIMKEYLEKGVVWQEPTNLDNEPEKLAAIRWMRACMAINKYLTNGQATGQDDDSKMFSLADVKRQNKKEMEQVNKDTVNALESSYKRIQSIRKSQHRGKNTLGSLNNVSFENVERMGNTPEFAFNITDTASGTAKISITANGKVFEFERMDDKSFRSEIPLQVKQSKGKPSGDPVTEFGSLADVIKAVKLQVGIPASTREKHWTVKEHGDLAVINNAYAANSLADGSSSEKLSDGSSAVALKEPMSTASGKYKMYVTNEGGKDVLTVKHILNSGEFATYKYEGADAKDAIDMCFKVQNELKKGTPIDNVIIGDEPFSYNATVDTTENYDTDLGDQLAKGNIASDPDGRLALIKDKKEKEAFEKVLESLGDDTQDIMDYIITGNAETLQRLADSVGVELNGHVETVADIREGIVDGGKYSNQNVYWEDNGDGTFTVSGACIGTHGVVTEHAQRAMKGFAHTKVEPLFNGRVRVTNVTKFGTEIKEYASMDKAFTEIEKTSKENYGKFKEWWNKKILLKYKKEGGFGWTPGQTAPGVYLHPVDEKRIEEAEKAGEPTDDIQRDGCVIDCKTASKEIVESIHKYYAEHADHFKDANGERQIKKTVNNKNLEECFREDAVSLYGENAVCVRAKVTNARGEEKFVTIVADSFDHNMFQQFDLKPLNGETKTIDIQHVSTVAEADGPFMKLYDQQSNTAGTKKKARRNEMAQSVKNRKKWDETHDKRGIKAV